MKNIKIILQASHMFYILLNRIIKTNRKKSIKDNKIWHDSAFIVFEKNSFFLLLFRCATRKKKPFFNILLTRGVKDEIF